MKKATKNKPEVVDPQPKRMRLDDRQARIFLQDMHEFGYRHLTIAEVRRIADEVAEGTQNTSNVIAIILAKQLDEIAEIQQQRANQRSDL